MGIGLAISFIVPFPISIVMALLVFILLNTVRMHIALKRQEMLGGMGYSPTKFYCMNCEFEHKENTCPKCGSKAVKVG
ncbi:MAG: hypothetical protein ACJ71K_15810 [Nitrososphaeraceae archaeon]